MKLTDEEIYAALGPFPANAIEWDDTDFVKLARAIEAVVVERCAKIVEEYVTTENEITATLLNLIAAEIRSRE